MKKMKKAAAVVLSAAMALSAASVTSVGASAEWVKTKSGYSYKDDSTGKKLTGWQTIGGSKYYFDKNGTALTGWRILNSDTYYFNSSKKGKMITGWAKISGKQYYFGSDGVMRKGWVKIKGSTYYFGSDGVMLTGTYKISGKTYSFAEDGKLYYTSAALGCNVLTATMGVTFNKSTVKEVEKALPFEDKIGSEEDNVVMFQPNKGCLGVYMFNSDGTASGCLITADNFSSMDEARPFFTEAGWKLADTRSDIDTSVEMYVSPDKTLFGHIMLDDDGSLLILAASYEDIDYYYYDYFDNV